MSDDALRGRFVWYDLMTTDPDGAGSFYKEAVGWQTAPWEGGPTPYTMWMNGETSVGGVVQLSEDALEAGAPPHWLAYIATPDVDATISRATELGGKVMVPPTDIPTVGRFSVLADPSGAAFAAYTPEGDAPGHEGPGEIGEFSWHELYTSNYSEAFGFYTELFGWEKTDSMDMGEGNIYQMFGTRETTYGGMMNRPPQVPVPTWLYYVRVEDVHAAVERIKELGGQVTNGPMEVPGGDYVAHCIDPQGAAFAIHSTGHGQEETGQQEPQQDD